MDQRSSLQPSQHNGSPKPLRRCHSAEAIAACAYAVLLIAYLFFHQENEALHWLSLVGLPLAGMALVRRSPAPQQLLATLQLSRTSMRRGWWWVMAFAVPFQVLQLLNRAQAQAFFHALHGGRGIAIVLTAPILLFATAATTEEVFFRGVLQRSVADATRSNAIGGIVGVVAFLLYHLPYAYLTPGWQTMGQLGPSFQAACASGLVGGIPLALVYVLSRRNLLAVIILHAAFDFVPAIRLLDRMLPP